jgi:hypothetical protein
MGGVLVLGLVVTGVGLALIVMGNTIWIAALVVGPVAMALSAAAMFARMPVYRSPQDDNRLNDLSRSQ